MAILKYIGIVHFVWLLESCLEQARGIGEQQGTVIVEEVFELQAQNVGGTWPPKRIPVQRMCDELPTKSKKQQPCQTGQFAEKQREREMACERKRENERQ